MNDAHNRTQAAYLQLTDLHTAADPVSGGTRGLRGIGRGRAPARPADSVVRAYPAARAPRWWSNRASRVTIHRRAVNWGRRLSTLCARCAPPIPVTRRFADPPRDRLSWKPVAARHADVAQLVAHHLAKVRVAGSNPVIRSTPFSTAPPQVPALTAPHQRPAVIAGCGRPLLGREIPSGAGELAATTIPAIAGLWADVDVLPALSDRRAVADTSGKSGMVDPNPSIRIPGGMP